ncbi:MAG: hypothetical protein IKE52_00390 [Mogibacterium sp.]|nr:hypothetical protein [Mogibacterium sp.]
MRLALLIKDIEYRKAFEEAISDFGNDVFLDIIAKGDSIEADALILTDLSPSYFDSNLLNAIKGRTIFLTCDSLEESHNSQKSKLNTAFKYSSMSRLLADISEVYHSWRGLKKHNAPTSRIIVCCSDSDAFTQHRCTRLASQIVYRQGGSVLILPLGYISEEGMNYSQDLNRFARLMYRIRKGRIGGAASFSYTDSYGISRLILPRGRNPIAYLDSEDLSMLILALSKLFETLILDIGGCYREENLAAIRNASSVLSFQTGRRRINFQELIPKEHRDKLRTININDESEEGFALDEYIRELYGIDDEK